MKLDEEHTRAIWEMKAEKAKRKAWHNSHLKQPQYQVDDLVLLYGRKFRINPRKMKLKWMGPCKVNHIWPNGVVQLRQLCLLDVKPILISNMMTVELMCNIPFVFSFSTQFFVAVFWHNFLVWLWSWCFYIQIRSSCCIETKNNVLLILLLIKKRPLPSGFLPWHFPKDFHIKVCIVLLYFLVASLLV